MYVSDHADPFGHTYIWYCMTTSSGNIEGDWLDNSPDQVEIRSRGIKCVCKDSEIGEGDTRGSRDNDWTKYGWLSLPAAALCLRVRESVCNDDYIVCGRANLIDPLVRRRVWYGM